MNCNPHNLSRPELEHAYLGLLCENRRLKEKARAHRVALRSMNRALAERNLQLANMRAQLEQVKVLS